MLGMSCLTVIFSLIAPISMSVSTDVPQSIQVYLDCPDQLSGSLQTVQIEVSSYKGARWPDSVTFPTQVSLKSLSEVILLNSCGKTWLTMTKTQKIKTVCQVFAWAQGIDLPGANGEMKKWWADGPTGTWENCTWVDRALWYRNCSATETQHVYFIQMIREAGL